jgi:hypothetical protein
MDKPKGIALTIGLNSVDPGHYAGWSGDLKACEFDANDMAEIARKSGFEVKTLLTEDATRDNVKGEISDVASELKSGDMFMLCYSGHGGQIVDLNDDEYDHRDETWCLYDGELIDDEIFDLLAQFRAGVRIVSTSDSCHSGTVLKAARPAKKKLWLKKGGEKIKCMPERYEDKVYTRNKAMYDDILTNKSLKTFRDVEAGALLISGCMDDQFSYDGLENGLFTETLLKVWNGGSFTGGYKDLVNAIRQPMPFEQTPTLFEVGNVSEAFLKQKPFTI